MSFICIAATSSAFSQWAVTITPSTIYSVGTGTIITSDVCAASASGGTPPYTYLWQQVAPPSGAISILTPNSSSTQWRATSMAAGALRTGDYRVRVTDAVGAVVNSGTVTVTLENVSPGYTPGRSGVIP